MVEYGSEIFFIGLFLVVAVAAVTLSWLRNSFRAWRGTRLEEANGATAFDPHTEALPDDVRAYFDQVYAAVAPLGFELAGCATSRYAGGQGRQYSSTYRNRATGDGIGAMFLIRSDPKGFRAGFVDFVTRFADRFLVHTSNSPFLTSLPKSPLEHFICFPDVTDLALLSKVHRYLVEKLRPGEEPVNRLESEFGGDVAKMMRAVWAENLHSQAERGVLVRTQFGYRLSIRGAMRFAWKNEWPMNRILSRRRQQQAEAILLEYYATAAYGAKRPGPDP